MSHAQSLRSLEGSRGDIDPYQDHEYLSHNDRHPQRARNQRAASPAQRKAIPASLAQIQVPSFSTFRSQLPVTPSGSTPRTGHHTAFQPARASFSRSEKASPRLADPTARPVSVDSPQLLQPSQFNASTSSPSWSRLGAGPLEDR